MQRKGWKDPSIEFTIYLLELIAPPPTCQKQLLHPKQTEAPMATRSWEAESGKKWAGKND